MKYAILDTNGLPTAFYSDDIHSNIPQEAIEITNEQWLECINNQGQRAFINGALVTYVPTITPEQAQQAISYAIQNMLDTKAQSMRYDNMMSARSYAGYVNPFQVEAQSLAVWGADCWQKAGEIDADVESGKRPMPTADEVLAEMPTL